MQLLGADGYPLPARPRRASMLSGASNTPYDAVNLYGSHVEDWMPYLWSPDGEINMYHDRLTARARDLIRNDGWATAAVMRTVDNVIGPDFRPIAKPDYVALRAMTGNKAFDHVWADEFGQQVEANWRAWAHDTGFYCDSERALTIPQMMQLAFRHQIIDGDCLAMMHWLPERVGRGRARYATAVQIIDPDRLSNPQLAFDQQSMRGGVEVDEYGVAVAYWIRRAHQGDWFSAAKSVHWDRIPRETEWGRPIIIHNYDHDRASQHRGIGFLTPVLQRFKMLTKYDSSELDAAIINAFFAAYIQSPFDGELVEEALSGSARVSAYQEDRAAYHRERGTRLGDVSITHLYPGETMGFASAARPSSNFAAFESAMLRNFSAATGLAAQQISQNWSEVNYSAYRSAMLEAWKTFHRRRVGFASGFAQRIYCAWLEESMEVDDYTMPRGEVPDFIEARAAYSRAKWLGPGRGLVDIVKERQGAILGINAGLSSLEDECAEISGTDWREIAARRALEAQRYKELGLTVPTSIAGENAREASKLPEEE
ncbi:phage portal protein [Burkholderia multivorans]|uniref:phage portal protein n=1 Tax=Burkholderia multivorans TaxID=87883 RepID=UPI001EFA0C59|nr:phage portal protein [Burkholderia multivorans]MDN7871276.1 phage portal protein [Burkholderia multivorans]